MRHCQQEDKLKVVSDCLYVRDAMYSSYTSILLVVVTHCCLHSRYQQAEIGRAGTFRHPALDSYQPYQARSPVLQTPSIYLPRLVQCSNPPSSMVYGILEFTGYRVTMMGQLRHKSGYRGSDTPFFTGVEPTRSLEKLHLLR